MKSFVAFAFGASFLAPLLWGCGNAPQAPDTPNLKPPAQEASFKQSVESSVVKSELGALLAEAEFLTTLQASKAKYIVIQVFAEKCGPCMEEALKLSSLAPEWSKRGVAVIGLAFDPRQESVQRFFEDTGRRVTFPLYCAPWFAEKHEVLATPTLFVFSFDGKKVYVSDPLSMDATTIEMVVAHLIQ
ncbi:MAG: TlpA family protein disulfide reductase [Planctomycetes bacterium]|nr:TlpA family protein disulfide reductase [Planctomycetota bacterium]